jgi:hypothetical protein
MGKFVFLEFGTMTIVGLPNACGCPRSCDGRTGGYAPLWPRSRCLAITKYACLSGKCGNATSRSDFSFSRLDLIRPLERERHDGSPIGNDRVGVYVLLTGSGSTLRRRSAITFQRHAVGLPWRHWRVGRLERRG